MSTRGNHLLAEYWDCDRSVLDDATALQGLMRAAAEAAGATVINTVFNRFEPQGVTGVVLLAESHLSIHTWPEEGYAAVDFYTCGLCRPEAAHDALKLGLRAGGAEVMHVERGAVDRTRGLRVAYHRVETASVAPHDEPHDERPAGQQPHLTMR